MAANRTAIVTGAGKRVGRHIAEQLLAKGWTVIAHVHGPADEVPAGAVRVVADLAEPDCGTTVMAAAKGLPPVTLLINNAARFAHDTLDSFSPEEFDAHMAVNVRAPALLIAAFARLGGEDRSVVNLLDAKLAAPNPDFLSYTLSKAALASLTELAARALAPKRIRVNAIAPALMLHSAGQSAENFRLAHVFNPLARGVEPADVVAAIQFCLDSPVLTGEVLTLDGGQRFWSLDRDVQFLDFE
ncbi:SDR family oxidoreductase [Sphingomonas sp. GCM10030256]|uniref:SDR family oxidoreductase n=1 Tax=Sphingomonas sp. GCM10030256 TaxID=3273427 RepID=UPI00361693D7